jgi:hypothetical protein
MVLMVIFNVIMIDTILNVIFIEFSENMNPYTVKDYKVAYDEIRTDAFEYAFPVLIVFSLW